MFSEEKNLIVIFSQITSNISNNSHTTDGVPAQLLKKCSTELCKPIRLIWEESMESGVVPDFYKNAFISPQYKKGNRADASNYRPVSLTSHVIKLYERILRNVLVKYIEENSLLSGTQHGFRKGRSCLTQLLDHFNDVMEGHLVNEHSDCIYLDYA